MELRKKRFHSCRKRSCAAYDTGYCNALSDTDFGGRECPFYKSDQQNTAERKACRERLKRLGLGGLTEKYERVEAEQC